MVPADFAVPPRAPADSPSVREGGRAGSPEGAAAFAEFRQRVIGEPALHAALLGYLDFELFAARAVELGAERGLVFGAEDVRAARSAARREWTERHIA